MNDELSVETIAEWKEVFDFFDKKKEGSITKENLCKVMEEFGANPSPADLEEMIKKVKTNHSGKIKFEEFLDHFAEKIKSPDNEEDFIEVFKFLDKDGDGSIKASELKEVMKSLGDEITDVEAKAFIDENDLDNDGYINYFEFVNIMKNK